MREPTLLSARTHLLLVAVIVATITGCSGLTGAAPAPVGATSAEVAVAPSAPGTAAPTAGDPTPRPRPSEPLPPTDGLGDEVVEGVMIDSVQSVMERSTPEGDHTAVRGGEVVATHAANDPRVTGRSRIRFDIDWYEKVGSFWATETITGPDGTWTGPCSGDTITHGAFGAFTCWLSGTGAYDGYTYFVLIAPYGAMTPATEGVIYRGEPPADR